MPRCANGHSVMVTSCPACQTDRGLSASPSGDERFARPPPMVDPRMVTTLQTLPGHRTVAVLGVVSELSATSGWTASSKGGTALENAMYQLRRTAASMGANAILGVVASSFGAGGGITNMLGGDAVGVLLLGTAVATELDVEGHGLLDQ